MQLNAIHKEFLSWIPSEHLKSKIERKLEKKFLDIFKKNKPERFYKYEQQLTDWLKKKQKKKDFTKESVSHIRRKIQELLKKEEVPPPARAEAPASPEKVAPVERAEQRCAFESYARMKTVELSGYLVEFKHAVALLRIRWDNAARNDADCKTTVLRSLVLMSMESEAVKVRAFLRSSSEGISLDYCMRTFPIAGSFVLLKSYQDMDSAYRDIQGELTAFEFLIFSRKIALELERARGKEWDAFVPPPPPPPQSPFCEIVSRYSLGDMEHVVRGTPLFDFLAKVRDALKNNEPLAIFGLRVLPATRAEFESIARKGSLQCHPDKYPSCTKEAAELFKLYNEVREMVANTHYGRV